LTHVRILHVIPYMHASAGGPPVVVENFVRECQRLGHQAEIVSTNLFCQDDEEALLHSLNLLAPTSFVSVSRLRALSERHTSHRLSQSVRTAEIVHVHTLWHPMNAIVRRECVRQSRPFVLMPHGMLDPYSLSVKRWRKALYLWAVEQRNIAAAERLIYTTAEEARLAATQIASLPKAAIVPLGGDAPAENSEQLASEFLERFPQAQGRRRLVFLGRLHFKKGLDRILLALTSIAKRYPDVLLSIVGDGEAGYRSELNDLIATHDLQGHVLLTGRLSGRAKWSAYAAAELFLLPSRQENFAITVAEAMHMGLPVIISDRVNTWPYVVEAGAGLVLADTQVDACLAEAISSLLQDADARKRMGKQAECYARTNLTWKGAAAKLLEFYQEVLAVSASRRNTFVRT
jgi:glycosyltransferase involved in cell wall biosynthesis